MRIRNSSQRAAGAWAFRSAASWRNATADRWTLSERSPARGAHSSCVCRWLPRDRHQATGWGEGVRAAICTAYGPPEVLQIRMVPDPRPRDKEVCIRLSATAVTASDCLARGLKLRGVYRLVFRAVFGIRAPRKGIIGMIAAGEIESVGRDVTSFKPGDQVFGMNGFRAGTYAEKVCWPASSALALRPANLTYEESAALPYGGLIASFFVRRLKVRKGQRMLVYGASGAIGTSALQLSRNLGAEVTGVGSTANPQLVRW